MCANTPRDATEAKTKADKDEDFQSQFKDAKISYGVSLNIKKLI